MAKLEKKDNISINLNCYTVRFRKKGQTKEYATFGEVFENVNFNTIAKKFIKALDLKHFKNKAGDRKLSLKKTILLNQSTFSGIIMKGHSGHETYVEEFKGNKSNVVSTILTNQFTSSPFYFVLNLPNANSKHLFFLAQSYKQYGFKEVFEEAFTSFFKANFGEEYICEFITLSIASLFKKYVSEGSIRRFRLRKYSLIPELEKFVENSTTTKKIDKKDFEVELSLKAKKRGLLNIPKNINFDNSSFIEIFPVKDFEYDEALVDMVVGNRKRVLNFMNPESFVAAYDVTQKINLDKITKHPNFTKLHEEAISILNTEIIPNIN